MCDILTAVHSVVCVHMYDILTAVHSVVCVHMYDILTAVHSVVCVHMYDILTAVHSVGNCCFHSSQNRSAWKSPGEREGRGKMTKFRAARLVPRPFSIHPAFPIHPHERKRPTYKVKQID